ncbi:MAG: hypothetical protein U1F36_05980 [Planctomycetota bacterium]
MSQQNDDFISFEKALRDLKMQSEELRKLVSEGDIRAFRDGDSMKFRREDLDELRRNRSGELVFSENLEDDTGMVTEEISADDTLLEDDEEVVAEAPRAATVSASSSRGSRVRSAGAEKEGEPGWVLAAAIVTAALMLFGFAQAYWINSELPPTGMMSMWAK